MPPIWGPLLTLAGYLVGSISFGLIEARRAGVDLRGEGSGNIGATNVGRALGRPWALLAFAFDYLPHRPHLIPARADRFRATHIISGRWLTLPLCCQNYHLVHHLYPAVPFYGYGRVWHDQRDELLARGAREVPLLGAVEG